MPDKINRFNYNFFFLLFPFHLQKSVKSRQNRSIMNLKILLALVFAVAATRCGVNAHRLPQVVDNSIDSNKAMAVNKDWVEVTRSPPARAGKHGSRSLELECEVIGQPTPSVQWVHGSAQLSSVSTYIHYNFLVVSILKSRVFKTCQIFEEIFESESK
jgi:hypothetical protein